MKETKLTEVYCRPKTEEEWKIFGLWKNNYCLYAGSVGEKPQLSDGNWVEGSRTEVTVQHFLDLLNDSIVGWRLEEIGFEKKRDAWNIGFHSFSDNEITWSHRSKSIEFMDNPMNITTFSDLLTLIRFRTF